MFDSIDAGRAAVLAAALSCSGASVAADSSLNDSSSALERPYVTISGAYARPDDKRQVSDGIGLKLSIGRALSERWSAELRTNHFNFETDTPGGTDFYRTALGLDAVYSLNPSSWSPLLVIGAGAAYNDVTPDARDRTDFSASAGLGLLTPALNDYGVRVRLEARYVYDSFEDNREDVHAYLGMVFPLRKPRTIEVVRTEIKEVIREKIVREEISLPLRDSDVDGVIDALDRCPDTLRGAQVDRDGCVIESSVIVLQGVHFEYNSAQLTSSSISILAQAVDSLRGQATMKVEVAGHTDSTGSDAYNVELSARRARSVVDFLISQGIDRSRLTSVGYGESRPVADNSTAEGRASNRRVEFRVLSR
jgi:OOP family OmpA-OmpF porin